MILSTPLDNYLGYRAAGGETRKILRTSDFYLLPCRQTACPPVRVQLSKSRAPAPEESVRPTFAGLARAEVHKALRSPRTILPQPIETMSVRRHAVPIFGTPVTPGRFT